MLFSRTCKGGEMVDEHPRHQVRTVVCSREPLVVMETAWRMLRYFEPTSPCWRCFPSNLRRTTGVLVLADVSHMFTCEYNVCIQLKFEGAERKVL